MSVAGLGSDSGGSVRLPAHFTGICALKPTPGRIPGRGHLPPCVGPFSVLGAIGPMARTMEDVTLLFETLSGADPYDPIASPVPLRKPKIDDLRSMTIGYFEDDGLIPVTRETRQAIQKSMRALTDAGFRVEPFRPRSLELLRKLWWKFFVRCGAMFYQSTIRGKEDQLSPIFREFLSIAGKDGPLDGPELLDAWAELDILRGKMLEEMASYPILLCPVASIPAFRHGERSWTIEGREVDYLDAVRHTQWFNVLAGPAAVVPVGRSSEGLPIGVQIAARPYEDEVVLAVAGILDKAFGYKVPPLATGGS
jgi:amidase